MEPDATQETVTETVSEPKDELDSHDQNTITQDNIVQGEITPGMSKNNFYDAARTNVSSPSAEEPHDITALDEVQCPPAGTSDTCVEHAATIRKLIARGLDLVSANKALCADRAAADARVEALTDEHVAAINKLEARVSTLERELKAEARKATAAVNDQERLRQSVDEYRTKLMDAAKRVRSYTLPHNPRV